MSNKGEICQLLWTISKAEALLGIINPKMSKLNPRQIKIILVLMNYNECAVIDIRKKVYFSKSTMTGLIDSLCEKGYVERKQGDVDRRKVKLKLTKEGRELAFLLREEIDKNYANLLNKLSEEERLTYKRSLIDLNTTLEKMEKISDQR